MSEALTPVEHDPFSGPELLARLPLTGSQREIWLAVQTLPECALAYNECGRLTLRGPLNREALLQSLQILVDRHEALRGSFSPDGEWMCVRASMTADITQIDATADAANLLRETEAAAVRHPFDLENGPLVRWTLVRESADLHHLIRCAHHTIVDGWSSWLLSYELGQLYSANVEGRTATLPAAPRYGDYAQAERDFLNSAEGRTHYDFWLNTLHDPPNALPLPHDRPRPPQRSFDAQQVDIALDPALVTRLRKLGSQHGASLVATTLAAFAATLHRQSGSEDLIIGLAAAGQSFHQQKNLVGHAVNLLPLRLKPRAEMTFSDLLRDTRAHVLDAFDHQGVSFGGIVPQLQFERDPARPPLVPIMFNIDVRSGDVAFSGLDTAYRSLSRVSEIFELFVNMVDDGKSLLLECSYNRHLFSEDAVRARMAEYQAVLAAVCESPALRLDALDLITPPARAMLDAFNQTAAPIPDRPLHERVASQAAQTPQAPALHAGDVSWTYAQLQARVYTLSAAFAAAGAGPGRFVGVCLPRNADLPATLLAVLNTGAAYVPLDPEFPPERLAYTLQDSGAALCVTDRAHRDAAPWPCPLLCLEELGAAAPWTAPAVPVTAPAYMLYTSGSTGQPKGVVVTHHNVNNCLASIAAEPGLSARDVVLGVSTFAFDISVFDLFLPFMTGAQLVLADRDSTLDGERLAELIRRYRISFLQCTPSAWRLLLQAGWQGSPSLRAASTGEPLTRDLAEQLLPRVGELWNLYGPTETTIWSSLYRVTDAGQPLLIGKPLANTRCHVLDAQGQEVPPGISGELWIGGAGLALGYHQRPELSAEKFVRHAQFGCLYRTGDLARLTPGGLECLGRVDFQIKLRGFRIELGEIEYALSRHEAVADSTVLVRERAPGDARLIAYVVGKSAGLLNTSELRERLRGFLPPYMLPQHFVELTQLPRLPNGKLARKALPDPFAQAAVRKHAPLSAAEQAVARIWSDILGLTDISSEDRFLDLGGHSLLAVRVAARLQQDFGLRLPLRNIMMESVAGLAAQLPANRLIEAPPAAPPPLTAPYRRKAPARGLWARLRAALGF